MIKFRQVLLATPIVLAVILSGCSPKVFTAKYTKSPGIQLATNVKSAQTQGGITIDMKPLDLKSEYEKPFYNQPIHVTYTPFLAKEPVTEKRDNIVQFFYGRSPFSVTITNSTDHILRMKDSRVVFIDPKSDEPISPCSKEQPEMYTDMQNQFPVFNLELSSWLKAYPMTTTLGHDITLAITNIIQKVKFINGFNMEIMPGMKVSGILLFPIDPIKMSEGKISFIDMISKVDAAGNTTEKVRFDYNTDLFYRYYKLEPNTNTFVEIKEDDYNKGLLSPEVYTYDKTQKKWVLGTLQK
jgi:hypothetical protein